MNRHQNRKVNILLVEIINRNLGDTVISETTEYLLQRCIPRSRRDHYQIHPYNIYSRDYAMVECADLIIFAGGGIIKYKREDFYAYIAEIVECAQKRDIPVYFNAVGIEGYDETDEKCQLLKNALNSPCVKGISVRDDEKTLRHSYLTPNNNIWTKQVMDTAFFTKKVYRVSADKTSHVIGLGITRSRLFEDHGMSQINKEFQLRFWKEIINLLEQKGYRWKLFVNGFKSDFDFAQEVLEYVGKGEEGEKYLVPRLAEGQELVETIASFQGIIAGRMHANIIAYSLGVPSIGLVWNDKLLYWGNLIGYPERFIENGNFQAEIIVNALKKSISQGTHKMRYVRKHHEIPGRSTAHGLKRFITKYGNAHHALYNEEPQSTYPWQDHMLATALGGIKKQYPVLNIASGISQSYDNGFRLFEADIRLTKDNQLVCVNGWSKTTFARLGYSADQYDKDGLPYSEFIRRKYHNCYDTMDFVTLLKQLRDYQDVKVILDLGKPSLKKLPIIIKKLQNAMKNEQCEKYILRVQTEETVEYIQELENFSCEIAYYMPPKTEWEKQNVTPSSVAKFCVDHNISLVTMLKEACENEIVQELKRYPLKLCVFSCDTLTETLQALKMGVDVVGTSFLQVNHLKELDISGI